MAPHVARTHSQTLTAVGHVKSMWLTVSCAPWQPGRGHAAVSLMASAACGTPRLMSRTALYAPQRSVP